MKPPSTRAMSWVLSLVQAAVVEDSSCEPQKKLAVHRFA